MLNHYKSKRIFDCFLFYNELELLELRFETLYSTVDKFVIVEANKTFSGQQKEFNYEKNKEKFNKYSDKIIYVKVDDSPEPLSKINYWNVEYFQRNCIMRGLQNSAKNGDFILVSDVDEIIDPDVLLQSLNYNEWVSFEQNLYYYFLNLKQNNNFIGPVLAKYGSFTTPEELRQSRHKIKTIKKGGWHFSFLGGAERIREKLSAYAEYQTNTKLLNNKDNIDYMIRNQMDIFERKNIQFIVVEIDETYPKAAYEFIKKYPQLLFDEKDTSDAKQPISYRRNFFQKKLDYSRKLTLRMILKIQKHRLKKDYK